MTKFIIVISSLIALCAATEDIFYSQKFIQKPEHIPAAFLHNGSYFPQLDHFRPQDTRTATFVSQNYYGILKKVFVLLKLCLH